MFSALAASASGVVSDRPPHSLCSARPVVPDILHRVWIGNGCPAVRDFISLLSAALLLEPRRLHYWVSNPSWESRCAMTVGGKRVALPEIAECHAALGVRFRHLNLSDAAHPFVRATKHFSIHRRYKGGVGQINPIQQTDLLRGWIMRTEGGYYFDSDVFIVGGGLRHFRHCPTVLGSNALDFFDFTTSVPGRPPERALAYLEALADRGQNRSLVHPALNSAMLLAAPNSSFLESYWRLLSGWDGRHGAENICCGWTSNYHASHPTEITAALSMRLFPFCLNDAANRTHSPRSKCPGGARNAADARAWIEHIGRIVERNATHAFHLANWKIRGHAHAAMLHFVLNNTERRARGLTDGHRKCLAVARRWLGAATPLPAGTLSGQLVR